MRAAYLLRVYLLEITLELGRDKTRIKYEIHERARVFAQFAIIRSKIPVHAMEPMIYDAFQAEITAATAAAAALEKSRETISDTQISRKQRIKSER